MAVDGRLHLEFDIASIGSFQNYTRSYYMNGRDHIISGSCEENVVRVCCAQTGRRLRDISFEVVVTYVCLFMLTLATRDICTTSTLMFYFTTINL